MRCQYELTFTCACPVDPSVLDTYELSIESVEEIKVERIHTLVAKLTAAPALQEHLTRHIAEGLNSGVRVVTRGVHSGVRTTCTVER